MEAVNLKVVQQDLQGRLLLIEIIMILTPISLLTDEIEMELVTLLLNAQLKVEQLVVVVQLGNYYKWIALP